MGSFNYNLHVKCDDPGCVAAAIRELLASDHWRPTDSPPDENVRRYGMSSNRRALWISTPVYGWVSVLDSDMAGAMSLATPLAEKLNAITLLCMVNDSDSWHYRLSRGDGILDEFDSSGDGGATKDVPTADLEHISQSMARLQQLIGHGSFGQRLEQLSQQVISSAPPEIQQLDAKIKQGYGTPDDLLRYQTWIAGQAPTMTALVQELMRDLVNLPTPSKSSSTQKTKRRKRKATKSQRAASLERIDNIRPLFIAGVTDEQFEETLHENAIFAEETLAKFLPLVGLPKFYAYLDYDHKDEASPAELAAHGIQFALHLMFENNS